MRHLTAQRNLLAFILWSKRKWLLYHYKAKDKYKTHTAPRHSYKIYNSTVFTFTSHHSKSKQQQAFTITDNASSIAIVQQIFLLGGYYNDSPSKKVFTISLNDLKLHKLPNMINHKSLHALAYFDSCIYISTGAVNQEATNYCEKYCILTKKHCSISKCHYCRLDACCSFIGNAIYLIGGSNTQGNVYNIEKLYPKACSIGWTEIKIKQEQNIPQCIDAVTANVGSGCIFILSTLNSFVLDTGFSVAYKCKKVSTTMLEDNTYDTQSTIEKYDADDYSFNSMELHTGISSNVYSIWDDRQVCKYTLIK